MKTLLSIFVFVVVMLALFLMFMPDQFLSWRFGFRITNWTGEEIVINDIHIPNKKAAFVVHHEGDLVVKRSSGGTWRYRDMSRGQFEGTPYEMIRHYPVPFGGGWGSVNLILNKDGRMYVVLPGATDVDINKLEQPKGFPMMPDDAKGMDKGSERGRSQNDAISKPGGTRGQGEVGDRL